jgi:hypothetical protein
LLAPYLLSSVLICKYIFNRDIKFAHVVFPKSVLVPAAGIEYEAVFAHNRHIEGLIPYWIEGFVDGRGGFFCVSEGKNEVLERVREGWGCRLVAMISPTGSLVPFLSLAARPRP